jgi:hypothetical protein
MFLCSVWQTSHLFSHSTWHDRGNFSMIFFLYFTWELLRQLLFALTINWTTTGWCSERSLCFNWNVAWFSFEGKLYDYCLLAKCLSKDSLLICIQLFLLFMCPHSIDDWTLYMGCQSSLSMDRNMKTPHISSQPWHEMSMLDSISVINIMCEWLGIRITSFYEHYTHTTCWCIFPLFDEILWNLSM